MIGFIIGVFVGVILGVVIMALMAAAKGGNEEMMLFMADQQVKHVCFWCCKLCRYVKWVGCFEHCGYQKTKEDNT